METQIGLIIAVVGVGIAMVGVVISMMFWVRTEANALRMEQREDRKDLLQIAKNMELDMKDFHHQLIELQRTVSAK